MFWVLIGSVIAGLALRLAYGWIPISWTVRPLRAMKRVFLSLLIAGGVVYTINTLLLPHTVRLIGDEKSI